MRNNLFVGKFQSLTALALKLDQMPKQFGTDQDLSLTNIHLIEIIGDNKDLDVTDIARLIGVTKCAVSMTALGNMAYWAHKHWHETMDGGFIKYLENLNSDQTGFLLDFLTRVEEIFHNLRIRSSDNGIILAFYPRPYPKPPAPFGPDHRWKKVSEEKQLLH